MTNTPEVLNGKGRAETRLDKEYRGHEAALRVSREVWQNGRRQAHLPNRQAIALTEVMYEGSELR